MATRFRTIRQDVASSPCHSLSGCLFDGKAVVFVQTRCSFFSLSLSTTCDTCIVSVRSLRRRRSWAFLRQLHPQEYWLSSLALSICRVVVHPTFFRFPAPIEPDLVGHDRENELVRFVIQDIFLSLSSFTHRCIEGFLKIRTTVTVFLQTTL